MTSSSTLLPSGYLSTSGNQFVDANGNYVRIASIGWNQNFTNISANVAQMAAAGFNTIRLSWVDATLSSDLPRIQQIVAAATANGMKVILDHHTNEAGTPADGYGHSKQTDYGIDTGPGTDGTNGVGVAGTVSAAQFQADWVRSQRRLPAMPLLSALTSITSHWNMATPHGRELGRWRTDRHPCHVPDGGQRHSGDRSRRTDYRRRADLIPLGNFDLTQVASNPVVLNIPNKVVYSAHIYPSAIGAEPVDSGPAFVANINKAYGYMETQNIAPVWIGEIGASLDGTADSAGETWRRTGLGATMVDYLNGKDGAIGGPTFTGSQQGMSTDWWDWGYNPGQYPDGVLNADGSLNAGQKASGHSFNRHPSVQASGDAFRQQYRGDGWLE